MYVSSPAWGFYFICLLTKQLCKTKNQKNYFYIHQIFQNKFFTLKINWTPFVIQAALLNINIWHITNKNITCQSISYIFYRKLLYWLEYLKRWSREVNDFKNKVTDRRRDWSEFWSLSVVSNKFYQIILWSPKYT